MRARGWEHLAAALALGVALGVPRAPPLLGYAAALVTALALRRLGLLRGARGALEFAGLLAVAWSLAASLAAG